MKHVKRKHVLPIGILLCVVVLLWLLFTPSGNRLRYLAADTLITTQHRHWAKYIIGPEKLQARVSAYEQQFNDMGSDAASVMDTSNHFTQTKKDPLGPLVQVEPISGDTWSGYLLTVSDPLHIRIGVPSKAGRGEQVSSMVNRLGALAGVNVGGFVDPNWSGNGFQPTGIVMTNGELYYNDTSPNQKIDIVGFSKQGELIAGAYILEEIYRLEVQEAVSFRPRFIINGQGLVQSDEEGWGIAPRTAVAQT
jgi:exopolysaccharide biosynthesis protein